MWEDPANQFAPTSQHQKTFAVPERKASESWDWTPHPLLQKPPLRVHESAEMHSTLLNQLSNTPRIQPEEVRKEFGIPSPEDLVFDIALDEESSRLEKLLRSRLAKIDKSYDKLSRLRGKVEEEATNARNDRLITAEQKRQLIQEFNALDRRKRDMQEEAERLRRFNDDLTSRAITHNQNISKLATAQAQAEKLNAAALSREGNLEKWAMELRILEKKLNRPPDAPLEKPECVVCMDKEATRAIVPCGHMVVCEDCARPLTNCPICRKQIHCHIKIFTS